MTNPPLPTVNWKAVNPDADCSPYIATDEHGNRWHQSANRERISLTTPDGWSCEGWTELECWQRYLASKKAQGDKPSLSTGRNTNRGCYKYNADSDEEYKEILDLTNAFIAVLREIKPRIVTVKRALEKLKGVVEENATVGEIDDVRDTREKFNWAT